MQKRSDPTIIDWVINLTCAGLDRYLDYQLKDRRRDSFQGKNNDKPIRE